VTQDEIIRFARDNLDGVVAQTPGPGSEAPEVAWGDTFFFYDPTGSNPEAQRFPFATIVTKDYGGFDEASNLNRPGVFRLNLWVSRETSAAVAAGDEAVDPATLDRLMPHPIYAAQSWVSVLNPGEHTADRAMGLLRESYERAVARAERRAGGDAGS
jgi:hypothetical protein